MPHIWSLALSLGAGSPLGALARAVLRTDIGSIYKLSQSESVRQSKPYKLAERMLSEKRSRDHTARVVYLPPLHLLWSLGGGGKSPAASLHRAYCRELWKDRSLAGRCGLLAMYLLWPFAIPLTMAWATTNNGKIISARTGKPISRQLIEQFSVAARHGILPPWYYIFELYDDDKRARAGEYLCRYETKGGLYRMVKSTRSSDRHYPLQDKIKFATYCREHGLPSVPELLIVKDGELQWPPGADQHLPRRDLFLKPVRGRGGTGAEVWLSTGDEGYRRTNGETASEPALLERLRGRNDIYIVQPKLYNHAAIAELSNGTLSTVRMLTILDEFRQTGSNSCGAADGGRRQSCRRQLSRWRHRLRHRHEDWNSWESDRYRPQSREGMVRSSSGHGRRDPRPATPAVGGDRRGCRESPCGIFRARIHWLGHCDHR